jgi:hypothetical protein
MDHVPVQDVFNFYKDLPAFQNVLFLQFQERLAGHQMRSARQRQHAARGLEARQVDRLIHPRDTKSPRGEPVFDLHPAQRILRMDVGNGVHKSLTPSKLQASRPAYQEFKPRIFKHRIYQEVRRQKFLYYLQLEREKAMLSTQHNNS